MQGLTSYCGPWSRSGGHDSGKSSVIRALARSDSNDNSRHDSRRNKGKAVAGPEQDKPDIGINFQYIDLADDGDSSEGGSGPINYRVTLLMHL